MSRPSGTDPSLPPELDARLAALERIPARDFDARAWFWMLLIGALVPIVLLVVGSRW